VLTSKVTAEFLADLSHELRTPLSGIIGFAELMHDGKLGPLAPDHQEYLGDILGSARHLQRILNELLDLAKVESGTLELRPEPVDLTTLLDDVCDALKTLASQKSIEVTTTVDPDVTGIVADPARLEQILRCTITKALKVTPYRGRVAIRLTSAGSTRFRIEVEDGGTSGAPVDSSLNAALTRGIVEAQGGEVGLHTAPEHGSTFFAVLPRLGRRGG
jgi:signal transduction histidine kinase